MQVAEDDEPCELSPPCPTVDGRHRGDVVGGKNFPVLTDRSANYGLPSWSPDGRQIVFRLAGRDRDGLVIADVATGAVRPLTTVRSPTAICASCGSDVRMLTDDQFEDGTPASIREAALIQAAIDSRAV